MTNTYTSAKIREALIASQGSRARAQRILFEWAQTDDLLLRGLVQPFLKAIVTSTVEHATRPKGATAPAARTPIAQASSAQARRAPAQSLSPEALDMVLSRMGQGVPPPAPRPARAPEPPPAVAEVRARPAGLALGTTNPVPPKAAGPKHVATMKALAAAFARKHER
jgi:hypothetical protein